jgi:NAD(P)-dependent dehydrogenase (short-subunit alcohol dehydrogenase family)
MRVENRFPQVPELRMTNILTGLKQKTVVVTGGGNGIGREMSIRFASCGARVVSVDIDDVANQKTAALAHDSGGKCQAVQGDVSLADDVSRAFAIAAPVDVLINNAFSATGDGLLHEVSEDIWDRVLTVTLKSVYLCSRAVLPEMMQREQGVIVNISSVNALTGIHLAAYTAAKGAINSLTQLLASQYGQYGIRVNAICPGTIMTENSRAVYEKMPEREFQLRKLYPGAEFGQPSDVASFAVYLASDAGRFFNGAVIPLDGGLSAVHRLL